LLAKVNEFTRFLPRWGIWRYFATGTSHRRAPPFAVKSRVGKVNEFDDSTMRHNGVRFAPPGCIGAPRSKCECNHLGIMNVGRELPVKSRGELIERSVMEPAGPGCSATGPDR
jgi:hypothetical protein